MFRTLIADLEAMLATAKAADLLPRSQGASALAGNDAAAFSQWLPYRAYLARAAKCSSTAMLWASASKFVPSQALTRKCREC
jgi:hypothetical protein